MNINFTGHLKTSSQLDKETLSSVLQNKNNLQTFNRNLGVISEMVLTSLPHEDTVSFSVERNEDRLPVVKIKVDVPEECDGRYPNLRQYAGRMAQTFALLDFARFGRAQMTDVTNTINGTLDQIKDFTYRSDIARDQCEEIRDIFRKVDNDGVLKEQDVSMKDFMRTFNDRQFTLVKINLNTLENQLQQLVGDSGYKAKISLKHNDSAPATLSIELIVPESIQAACPKAARIAASKKQSTPLPKLHELGQTSTKYMVDQLGIAMKEINAEMETAKIRQIALTNLQKMTSDANQAVKRLFRVNIAALTKDMPNSQVINLERNLTALTDEIQKLTLPGDRVVIELDRDAQQHPIIKTYITIPDHHESAARGLKVMASSASGESYLMPFAQEDASKTITRLVSPIKTALTKIHNKVDADPELLLSRTMEFLNNQ